jgi:hypothetical protein
LPALFLRLKSIVLLVNDVAVRVGEHCCATVIGNSQK